MCYCNGLPAHFFRGVHPTWIHLVTHCPRPGCHGVILNPQCDGLGQAMFGNHIGNPAVSIPPKVVARVAGGAANYPTLAAVLAELQAVATIATAVEARSWVDRLLAAAAIDDGISEFEANWKRDQFYLSEGRLEHLLDIPLSPDGYRHFFFEVLSCPKGPLWDRTADRYWAYSDALTDCESDGVFKITGSPILGINPFRPQGCRRSDPEGTSEDCHRLEAADYLCGSRDFTYIVAPILTKLNVKFREQATYTGGNRTLKALMLDGAQGPLLHAYQQTTSLLAHVVFVRFPAPAMTAMAFTAGSKKKIAALRLAPIARTLYRLGIDITRKDYWHDDDVAKQARRVVRIMRKSARRVLPPKPHIVGLFPVFFDVNKLELSRLAIACASGRAGVALFALKYLRDIGAPMELVDLCPTPELVKLGYYLTGTYSVGAHIPGSSLCRMLATRFLLGIGAPRKLVKKCPPESLVFLGYKLTGYLSTGTNLGWSTQTASIARQFLEGIGAPKHLIAASPLKYLSKLGHKLIGHFNSGSWDHVYLRQRPARIALAQVYLLEIGAPEDLVDASPEEELFQLGGTLTGYLARGKQVSHFVEGHSIGRESLAVRYLLGIGAPVDLVDACPIKELKYLGNVLGGYLRHGAVNILGDRSGLEGKEGIAADFLLGIGADPQLVDASPLEDLRVLGGKLQAALQHGSTHGKEAGLAVRFLEGIGAPKHLIDQSPEEELIDLGKQVKTRLMSGSRARQTKK